MTLLGDAAHLSAPNGEGANLAMLDAAELGRALAEHPGDVETALAVYERVLFPRSARAAVLEAGEELGRDTGDVTPHDLIATYTEAGRS